MVTVEKVTRAVYLYKVDKLGRTYCGNCLNCGKEGKTDYTQDPTYARGNAPDYCDCCGKPPEDWPEHQQECTAAVEHFPCKIF